MVTAEVPLRAGLVQLQEPANLGYIILPSVPNCVVRLDQEAALYAWHGRHHVAHITGLRERMGWK
jgi:hypothetical protein